MQWLTKLITGNIYMCFDLYVYMYLFNMLYHHYSTWSRNCPRIPQS